MKKRRVKKQSSSTKMKGTGKLVPEKYENPIDNFFIQLAKIFSPLFLKLGFTPNGITTLCFVLVFPLIYFYQIYNNFIAVFFLLFLYLCDTVEEYQAKKYNLETDFVDYYDHFKDIVVFFVIDFFIFLRLYFLTNETMFTMLLVITLILFLFMQAHIKNHQEFFDHKHKSRARKSLFVKFSDNMPIRIIPNVSINFSKWFGVGTFVLWNCFLIFYSNILTF